MNLPVDYVQLLAEVKVRIQTAQLRAAFAANSELMLAFFRAYVEEPVFVANVPDEKVPQPVAQMADPAEMPQLVAPKEGNTQLLFLPWGHHVMLLEKVKPLEQRLWYVEQSLVHGWSRNVLQAQIASGAYHRQGQALTNFFSRLPAPQSDLAQQTLKDPYVFEFLTIEASFHERELETGLIKHLEAFLLELGQGFAFVGRQPTKQVGKRDVEGVFIVGADNKVSFRPVKVGIAGERHFEVLDGLKAGEKIVAGTYQAIRELKDGALVKEAVADKKPAEKKP
jgi:predicted nuclease of restriction endonuclease-like (RecB) superfamily